MGVCYCCISHYNVPLRARCVVGKNSVTFHASALLGTDFGTKWEGLGLGAKKGHFPYSAGQENHPFRPRVPSPVLFPQIPPFYLVPTCLSTALCL